MTLQHRSHPARGARAAPPRPRRRRGGDEDPGPLPARARERGVGRAAGRRPTRAASSAPTRSMLGLDGERLADDFRRRSGSRRPAAIRGSSRLPGGGPVPQRGRRRARLQVSRGVIGRPDLDRADRAADRDRAGSAATTTTRTAGAPAGAATGDRPPAGRRRASAPRRRTRPAARSRARRGLGLPARRRRPPARRRHILTAGAEEGPFRSEQVHSSPSATARSR